MSVWPITVDIISATEMNQIQIQKQKNRGQEAKKTNGSLFYSPPPPTIVESGAATENSQDRLSIAVFRRLLVCCNTAVSSPLKDEMSTVSLNNNRQLDGRLTSGRWMLRARSKWVVSRRPSSGRTGLCQWGLWSMTQAAWLRGSVVSTREEPRAVSQAWSLDVKYDTLYYIIWYINIICTMCMCMYGNYVVDMSNIKRSHQTNRPIVIRIVLPSPPGSWIGSRRWPRAQQTWQQDPWLPFGAAAMLFEPRSTAYYTVQLPVSLQANSWTYLNQHSVERSGVLGFCQDNFKGEVVRNAGENFSCKLVDLKRERNLEASSVPGLQMTFRCWRLSVWAGGKEGTPAAQECRWPE
mgnify:CR=1 FL=1